MPHQILALSGGGFLGLYTACVLANIEEASGRPLAQQFDLIAGTSIGGIIALGLAAGCPAAVIRDAMIDHGPQIFTTKPPPQSEVGKKWALTKNATHALYRPDRLRVVVEQIVGKGHKIGDEPHHHAACADAPRWRTALGLRPRRAGLCRQIGQ